MNHNYSDVHSLQRKNFIYPEIVANDEKIFRVETKKFSVKITDDALKFLEKNPDLKLPLIYIESVVADYFKNSSLTLELVEENLLMSIFLKETPENALKKLWKFDEDWWLEHTNLMKKKLCIDVVAI